MTESRGNSSSPTSTLAAHVKFQVMREQKLGRIGHDAAPISRPRNVLPDIIATWARGRYG